MKCSRCGQPTVYKTGICRWCQTKEEKDALRWNADRRKP